MDADGVILEHGHNGHCTTLARIWLRTTNYGPRTKAMCDEWMPRLELPITFEQFHRLPRNAAYKYEYFQDTAWLNPRPRYYHALLDLEARAGQPVEGVSRTATLRPLRAADWEELAPLFAAAFDRQQPFCGLDDERSVAAARKSLRAHAQRRRRPVDRASQLCRRGGRRRASGRRHPRDPAARHGPEPLGQLPLERAAAAGRVARRLGRPHLTWIFVSPFEAGQGVGTLLLSAAVRELLALGYTRLASTFLIGNDSSMLWHWRNGFALLPYPGSLRSRKITT